MEQQRLMLRVRVESGIPKLLVKINPAEAEGFAAKNLGEVKLRKASTHRGHVAVLHMSYGVPPGELVMSLKLAELLDVEEEESVELTSALAAAAAPAPPSAGDRTSAPAPAPSSAAGAPARSTAAPAVAGSREADTTRRPAGAAAGDAAAPGDPNGRHPPAQMRSTGPPAGTDRFEAPDMGWFLKAESKYGRQPRQSAPTDGRHSASRGATEKPESAATSKSGSGRPGAFDFDWFKGLGLEQDSGLGWRDGRSQSAFTSSSERRSEQSTSQGQSFAHFADSATSAHSSEPLPQSTPEVSAPEWLRDLRAFAEWDVREASRPSVAADYLGPAGGVSSAVPSGNPNPSSSLGAGVSATAHGLHRGSSLHEGGRAESSDSWGLRSNSRPAGAAAGDAAAPGDPKDGRPKSQMREAECPRGTDRFEVTSDLPSERKRERWPFQWLGEPGKSSSGAGFSTDVGAGSTLEEKRQAQESSGSLKGASMASSPIEVDSLPASESSDNGEGHKVPGARRVSRGFSAGRAAVDLKAVSSSLADDFGFDGADAAGLSAAADLSAATIDWRRSLERVSAESSWRDQLAGQTSKATAWEEDVSGRHHDGYSGAHTSSVWDAPTPQRQGTAATTSHGYQAAATTTAESLGSSPIPSPRMRSHASSQPSSRSERSNDSSCSRERGTAPPLPSQALPPKGKTVRMAADGLHPSQASSRATSGHSAPPSSSPRERNQPLSSESPSASSPREVITEQAYLDRPLGQPSAIIPCLEPRSSKASSSAQQSRNLTRRKTVALGSLHSAEDDLSLLPEKSREAAQAVPGRWRAPSDLTGSGFERSELGSEVTVEVRQWLLGETSGPQCSQVVLDRALTVLANFKLASGCQLEVLGGPLGAIVGGYSDADWLHDEVFGKQPGDAIREAFMLLGFRGRADGDWSSIAAEEVSLSYRRLCLRGHPSRGGAPRNYLKLQVAMEIIRAFAGEAGPLEPSRTPRASFKDRTPPNASSCGDATPSSRFGMGRDTTPSSRSGIARSSSKDFSVTQGFVLNDVTLVRELQLTAAQAEAEAGKIPQEQLEEMNRALDEYILRQMCFKSEIVDEIARLHEDCAYAILGVCSDATDAEIKKAYRLIARACHPDKGGDKEDFQELTNAYEKIMEQRKSGNDLFGKGDDLPSDDEKPDFSQKKRADKEKADKAEKDADEGAEEDANEGDGDAEKANAKDEECDDDEYGEEGSNASLVEKAGKAAEEASRYAKTAAEFAHQAAEAAETARRGREQGSRDTLTKSIAHSAIVLTLTVVKAVRVVGYATLDVAAQCRIAAKRNPEALGCAERAVTAMSLGLEALNAALACAEVTETTAAELQAPPKEPPLAPGGPADTASSGSSTAAAERFVGAAVRASLAAASASNAAMSAAIAAVEGSRECSRAVEAQHAAEAESRGGGERNAGEAGETVEDADEDEEAEQSESVESPKPLRPPPPTPEEAAAAATRRLVAQRNNNHKVLQRLNAEILGHQQNVRQFLAANRQLIPSVSGDAAKKVFSLLLDYSQEARLDLERFTDPDENDPPATTDEILAATVELSMLTPFAQEQAVAIPVSVKARVLKMAALYDVALTMQVLEQEIFAPIRSALPKADREAQKKVDELIARILVELNQHAAA